MLIIRREQEKTLSRYMVGQFVEQAIGHLQERLPPLTEDISTDELRAFVTRSIDSAEGFNVTYEKDVLRYLELALTFGENFEKHPDPSWVKEILSQEMEGTAKISLINEHLERHLEETT